MSTPARFGVTMRARFRLYVDRPHVMARVERKKLAVLARVGAFGRRVMKNKYRKPLTGKRLRQVAVNGKQYLVPIQGRVIDLTTGQPCREQEANAARIELAKVLRHSSAGKPPRRGPTDNLYRFTDFGIDPATESAVIGAIPFDQQPRMEGRVSVPELLDKGGGEYIGNLLVQYDAYPFTAPSLGPTAAKMAQLVESIPL